MKTETCILKFPLLICAMLAIAPAHAGSMHPTGNNPSPCSEDARETLSVPYDYDQPTSQKFNYSFQYFKAKKPGSTTVIVIGGGPGQVLSGSVPDGIALGGITRKLFNVIYTDPRGAGLNAWGKDGAAFPKDQIQTPRMARDILEIVKYCGLKNYIVYGASYGTVLATTAASLAEKAGGVLPKALVLEGVVGHHFNGSEDYWDGFRREWARVKKEELDPKYVEAINSDRWPVFSAEDWSALIFSKLIMGNIPGLGHLLKPALEGAFNQNRSAIAGLKADLEQARRDFLGGNGFVYERIACDELWGSVYPSFRIEHGEFIQLGENLCKGVPLTRAYDSKSYPVSIPIFYFQGPFDPTSTYENARYHFDNHPEAKRYFVTVDHASHAPLTVGFYDFRTAGSCSPAVWGVINHDPGNAQRGLEHALGTCPSASRLEVRDATPTTSAQNAGSSRYF